MKNRFIYNSVIIICAICLFSCNKESSNEPLPTLQLSSVSVGSTPLDASNSSKNTNIPIDKPIVITFTSALDTSSVRHSISLRIKDGSGAAFKFSYLDNNRAISALALQNLSPNTSYQLLISNELKGQNNETFAGITIEFSTPPASFTVSSLKINNKEVLNETLITEAPLSLNSEVDFGKSVDPATINAQTVKVLGDVSVGLTYQLTDENSKLIISASQPLKDLRKFQLILTSDIKGVNGEILQPFSKTFYTTISPTPKFPTLSDDELLTLVQQQTFKYFYDYGHPVSGMARERNGSDDVVTSGGSGFGIMAMIVGMERNFITRQQGIDRLAKIVTFLEKADRFHGAWSHWIDGGTGKVIPFSPKDNGGDLVETSFLVQGLLAFRQYLHKEDTAGNNLINRITTLYNGVEWDWYRRNNEEVLYWHWSPNYDWQMNFALSGYFEEQITYVLAAASSTHGIPKSVYTNGYGKNGAIKTNATYYGYNLPLGSPAPLFWTQYSYLGLDPHFTDDYANYWTQNVNASLINYTYCVTNPKKFVGYGEDCWGLTASDNQNGYDAQSPTNDNGTITPTAALSAFPYTPVQSMKALKFFYYTMGDRLWGQYGFYDAFNITTGWTANSYLAIDQGPIVVMIENYRSGLLWNLFMSAPEVQTAKDKLGFTN